ncbi:MAG: sporulation integral membrane protein YlbJ [Syntrophomonas sp.]|nr:sporulation integral membrane protein YlbJ [Syntrophomonas sp.]
MGNYSRLFFLIIILFLAVFMLLNPQETVNAASGGFKLWFSIIVPALLPFFIVAELLVNLGVPKILGVLLEPIMRPLFNLPGCSSLVVAMGFTSGFPVGAILSKKLYDENMISGEEASRLLSFTNNCGPLFIIGAVGVGMFGSPLLGYILALSHYLSNLIVGMFWGLKAKKPLRNISRPPLAQELSQAIAEARKNYRGPGKLLSDAIKNSLNNVLAIAGFIILFSVITKMFSFWGIIDLLALCLLKIFSIFNLSYELIYGWLMGLFEITIGTRAITAASPANILPQLLAVSCILAWSGLSIIAQVMGIMVGTPVKLSFYLYSRLLQMFLSVIITAFAYKLLASGQQSVLSLSLPYHKALYSFDAWSISIACLLACLLLLTIMVATSLLPGRN